MPVFLFVEVLRKKYNKSKIYRKHGPATNSATRKWTKKTPVLISVEVIIIEAEEF